MHEGMDDNSVGSSSWASRARAPAPSHHRPHHRHRSSDSSRRTNTHSAGGPPPPFGDEGANGQSRPSAGEEEGGSGNGSANSTYVNLKIGNPLRSVHPHPIASDHVIVVPSLFGSELNWTTFEDLRQELEPVFRDKCQDRYWTAQEWSFDSTRTNVVLMASKVPIGSTPYSTSVPSKNGKGGGSTTATTPSTVSTTGSFSPTMDEEHNDDDDGHEEMSLDGDDDDMGGSGKGKAVDSIPPTLEDGTLATAVPAYASSSQAVVRTVVRRIGEYFMDGGGGFGDPTIRNANVSAGFYVGQPHIRVQPRRAHTEASPRNCYVLASFGSPRTLVLQKQQSHGRGQDNLSIVRIPLTNNSVVALMEDVSNQGWRFWADILRPEEISDDMVRHPIDRGGAAAGPERLETMVLFLSIRCPTMVRRHRDGPAITTTTGGGHGGPVAARRRGETLPLQHQPPPPQQQQHQYGYYGPPPPHPPPPPPLARGVDEGQPRGRAGPRSRSRSLSPPRSPSSASTSLRELLFNRHIDHDAARRYHPEEHRREWSSPSDARIL